MKKIKELLDDNFQGVLLVAGIAMANLVFFQQENWKMEPVKTALLSILFFFLLRIFAEQKEKSRDIREKAGIIFLGLLFGRMIFTQHPKVAVITTGLHRIIQEAGTFHCPDKQCGNQRPERFQRCPVINIAQS